MSTMSSFGANPKCAVVGASGGIGRALCEHILDTAPGATVYGFSRNPLHAPDSRILWQPLDIEDESSVEYATDALGDEQLDLVVVATGILHAGSEVRPERRLEDFDARMIERVFRVNAVGPAIVARHFLPRLRAGSKAVFAVLSARVGSIADNRLGGWASYRASKAALNQFIRTMSIEQRRKRPESVLVSLHPGTVATPLSAPFTSRTPKDKLFTPSRSARHLLSVVNGLSADDTGGFFAWDGTPIEY